MVQILIVAFPGSNLLDIAGPVQVFTTANEVLGEGTAGFAKRYVVQLVSASGGLIRTTSGIEISTRPLTLIGDTPPDTILVSGGHGADAAGRDERLTAWLSHYQPRTRRFGCICTGAFVLAQTGMLEGRRVATHWAYCDRLRDSYPDIQVERDAIFLEEDGFWSSAGVTAGMDLSLAMVEQDLGRDIALDVARRLVLFLKRPGGQSQFSAPLRAQSVKGPLSEVMKLVVENPTEDWRIEQLAACACMSERSLFRLFQEASGRTPATWVEEVRAEFARRLLEESDKSMEQIALDAGLVTAERLRRVFVRRFNVAPSEYRARFSRRTVVGGSEGSLQLPRMSGGTST